MGREISLNKLFSPPRIWNRVMKINEKYVKQVTRKYEIGARLKTTITTITTTKFSFRLINVT